MRNTTARLLNLLSLLQTPRDWSGIELAERLSASRRTVRRDIERLRELGYPVHTTRGTGGGYRLEAGRAMPPLLLDDEEAVAVAIRLRTGGGDAVEGIEDASARALAKLEQVLPARLRGKVTAVRSGAVSLSGFGIPVSAEHLTVMATACRNREGLRFGYRARTGAESSRHVEPRALVHAGRNWYLVAFDLDRQEWRSFRADRIEAPNPTGSRAAARELPTVDAASYVVESVEGTLARHQAVVTLHAPLETAASRTRAGHGMLEPIDAHTCTWRVGADSLDYLAFEICASGIEFEVHEPPELLDRLHALAALMTRGSHNTALRRDA